MDISTNPLVSVLIPIYNGERYIHRCLNSILNQTYENIEIIVINDGSTDSTDAVLNDYRHLKKITILNNDVNNGLIYSLNYGIAYCSGEYVARIDIDDYADSSRIESQVLYAIKNNIDVLSTNVIINNKHYYTYPQFHNEIEVAFFFYCPIVHPSVLIKRSIFKKFNYNKQSHLAEDVFLWLKLIKDYKFGVLQNYCVSVEKHNNNITNIKYMEHCDAIINVIEKYYEYHNILIGKNNIRKFYGFEKFSIHDVFIINKLITLINEKFGCKFNNIIIFNIFISSIKSKSKIIAFFLFTKSPIYISMRMMKLFINNTLDRS